MVYYRKYRPQTIDDLDNAKLRETLTAVLSSKDIPHAFLFTGPKGLGKTSTARIIAKVINCVHTIDHPEHSEGSPKNVQEQKKNTPVQLITTLEPDNTCEQCVSITNGTNVDVLEIDGASNRGIDEIRDLREKVKLSPAVAKKKVYIIDEVHMLTTEAFNALLKTIEEPPTHVMFIFCTTEPHKVPATIVSRCFHIALTLATEDELVRSFTRIVKGESLDIDTDVLHEIAKLSHGGFRDGVKILEEIVQLAEGKKITKEMVEEKYQTSNIQTHILHLLSLLQEKKTKESLELVKTCMDQGIDMKYFLSQTLEVLHSLLLQKLNVSSSSYNIEPTTYDVNDLQTLIGLVSEAYSQTKYAVIPQLPVELAIIAWCQTVTSNTAQVTSSTENMLPVTNGVLRSAPSMQTLLKKQQAVKITQMLNGSKGINESQVSSEKKDTTVQNDLKSAEDPNAAMMENLIYKVKAYNHSIAGILRGCKIIEVTPEAIHFEAAYKFHKDKLEEKKIQEILEKVLKEITGKSLQLVVELRK